MDPLALATTAVGFLTPYVAKAGEKAVEEVGKKLPAFVGNVWQAIMTRFKDSPVAAETARDLAAKPEEADNQAAFRKELRKLLETDATFAAELERLLDNAQQQSGDTIRNQGSGAVAMHGGVAAGAGGVAVRGDVQGGITLGGGEKKG
jgi:hypothetical protein